MLGVVITMQAIGGPSEEIGHKVGAALVGTFLGILLSYGFVQPVATSLEHRVGEEQNFEQAIKAGILALHKGFAPAIAVEFARRVIPEDVRPTFEETEQLCRDARTESSGGGLMRAKEHPIIIVRRKKAGHGGHHGGAWKVAYADFVTAMMAFFLVMWLSAQDSRIRDGDRRLLCGARPHAARTVEQHARQWPRRHRPVGYDRAQPAVSGPPGSRAEGAGDSRRAHS